MHGNYGPNVLTNECDVLIAVGMRFDDRVTGRLDKYAKQAKVIHLDIDPSEIDKNVKATVLFGVIVKKHCRCLQNWLNKKYIRNGCKSLKIVHRRKKIKSLRKN